MATTLLSTPTMVRWRLTVLVCALLCIVLTSAKTGPTHGKVVACYMATWAAYRPGSGYFSVENIDPNLCTHLVYFVAELDTVKDTIKAFDAPLDLKENDGKGGFERITALKKTYPHLKVSVAIGGWSPGSKIFSDLATDPNRRQRFVQQASEFLRKYNFDGLDLDWRYPTQRGGLASDRDTFVLLAKELHDEFKKHNLFLTSSVANRKDIIDQAYNIPELAKYLDYFHVICYDYHGSWDKKVGPNAPLEDEGELSARFTIEYVMKLGCPASKILLSIPAFGRSFETTFNGSYGDESFGNGFQGPYTRDNGYMGYNEICLLVSKKSGWTKSWDDRTSQAIARFTDQGITKVATYDSTRSVANKVQFAVRKGLAGIAVRNMDSDDFLGECDPEEDTFAAFGNVKGLKLAQFNSNYPLLRTVNEGIVLALEEIDQQNSIDIRSDQVDRNKNKITYGTLNCKFSLFNL